MGEYWTLGLALSANATLSRKGAAKMGQPARSILLVCGNRWLVA